MTEQLVTYHQPTAEAQDVLKRNTYSHAITIACSLVPLSLQTYGHEDPEAFTLLIESAEYARVRRDRICLQKTLVGRRVVLCHVSKVSRTTASMITSELFLCPVSFIRRQAYFVFQLKFPPLLWVVTCFS